MNAWRTAWPWLRPDRWRFLAALALAPAIAGAGLLQPLVLKDALDGHVVAGTSDGLGATALQYLACVVAGFVLEGAYTMLLATGAENSIARLRRGLIAHVLSRSQRFFERQPTGQVLTRVTSDVEALNEALTAGSISMVLDVLIMGGTLVAMALLDARLTGVLLVLGLPLAVTIDWFRRRMRVLFAEVRDALAALNTYLAERLAGVEMLQLHGQEARASARFAELDARHRDANVVNNVYDAALYALIDGVASLCVAAMLGYGAWRMGLLGAGAAPDVPDGVTVGLVVAFVDYVDRLFRPLREFSGKVTFLQRAGTALEKIGALLAVTEHITPGDVDATRLRGALRVRGLSFRYAPEAPDVLRDVSFDAAPGEVVAVVGRSGSGKSTLVRLLGRVHDGYLGSIELDGVELARISPHAVRRAMATVRQEVQLFRDTLRFNVTLGDGTLDPVRVDAAIEASNLGAMAARWPDGLDHVVRERGGNLSAGEAQLVALARALAREPAILVLDEATASVDPVTEQLLQQAVARLRGTRTCVVVAHRLSTIVGADRIVVLDGGRVVEVGRHAELLAAGGVYARLHAEGFGASA
jgi:ATP-binding cassette subfamily B multidrug efflux pump